MKQLAMKAYVNDIPAKEVTLPSGYKFINFDGSESLKNAWKTIVIEPPVPPFDGSRILFAVLPQKYYFQIMRYERYIFIGVFAIVYLGILDKPLDFLTSRLFNVIYNFIVNIINNSMSISCPYRYI